MSPRGEAEAGRRVLVLINRGASRAGELGEAQMRERLVAAGYAPRIHAACSPADFGEQIVEWAGASARVIVAGGDGTLNAALPALLATSATLAIVPLGTGNDFARALGIPADPAAALELAGTGRARAIDVGFVNGRPFLNSIGLGIAPALARDLDVNAKRRFGGLSYALAAARHWRELPAFTVTVEHGLQGRERFRSIAQLTIVNGTRYGGGMPIGPAEATPADGTLRLLAVPRRGLVATLGSLLAWRLGAANGPGSLVHREGQQFRVRCQPPQRYTVDGEAAETTPLEISLRRRALTVIVGPEAA